ncbi:putative ATP-dependent RNA helicase DDX27 [Liparis tanakae]|uniref:RNA helicase n=1 Tax=Liparis tanakae TaxID=230148 RepID=A0A4Z2EKY3_9TELE|nr:putative ATP-dependent RNA helicase DDX27 [Liparis tanakae]
MLEQFGLIGTIQDEDESPEESDTASEPEDEPIVLNRKKKLGTRGVKDFNADFDFAERDAPSRGEEWAMEDVMKQIKDKAPESFFDDASKYDDKLTFDSMNLSRPILKAVTALGFKLPTPIQKACVPVGLLGKDLCACAATGTGKTAAFMLPVLERLIYKPRTGQVTRVLVLVPTRELGIQVHSVARQLAQFTSITTCLAVGTSAGTS